MLDSNKYHSFFDEMENPISDYELTEELGFKFDCWFSNLLTEIKRDKNGVYYTLEHSIEDVADCISDDDLRFMCWNAGWYEEVVFDTDLRNAVYWYALRLLYIYKENYVEEGKCPFCDGCLLDYSGVFDFLNSITIYNNIEM